MSAFTYTETETFTVTHAKHIAAKVATDLLRMNRLYGSPSISHVDELETEIVELLKHGYFGTATYGFQKNGNWIEPTLQYTARDLMGNNADNHDPGRIRPGADTMGALFNSYVTYSDAWSNLTYEQKTTFKNTLPFFRTGADEPGVDGYLDHDKTYSAGGRALDRSSVRRY